MGRGEKHTNQVNSKGSATSSTAKFIPGERSKEDAIDFALQDKTNSAGLNDVNQNV